ncbi:MAG: DUF2520 domain-containing protein [Ruminococcus sp.]|nr:DUF2520 domain-containing protein [Ruminococcus sp.]
MEIGFIGAGKVGFSLGKYFTEHGVAVKGYYSRDPESARAAAEFTGTSLFTSTEELLAACDTIFITVPDGAIKEVYLGLDRSALSGKTLCHCSGAMSSEDAFPRLAAAGGRSCSVHPLFPVNSKYQSYKELGTSFFCLEGDAAPDMQELMSSLGNPTRMITAESKAKYHAACVVSSNLVCALAAESISLLKDCGFSAEEGLTALAPMVMSNIRKVLEVGPAEALTGPVERNDISTVRKHLKCIPEGNGREMYRAVTRRLIAVAEERHPDSDYSEMKKIIK